ncbi:23S rRNA (adenine(2503)-C(2))-methyltransferase RlmN [Dethiosulfovibrio salsuginis]|uniref:Probable dual-specificity RNA methyltransferase RlmN n=1 Tax=Dethiosulfovibrio salsuginis TaxID=561720 RepID=A0A1X7KJL7_9BACT|nr:23S rRNA (adenine(2503)-C(2))-methyltransferase RlmN [Dethiosulfovibrio salsuginis]SMG41152.1 23S rRNA m(2)A-2503 methyltransferase [Dethiosulfovibrio salsuginis]
MSEMTYGLDFNYDQWRSFTEELGEPAYRADQLCQWIYQKKIFDVNRMTNLSKPLREGLVDKLYVQPPFSAKVQTSQDKTVKFLWRFLDGNEVESVLMDHGNHHTACLSTQVGCPLRCDFCATGRQGFVRNLTAGEIVGHLLAMESWLGQDIKNVVFMGMGEPLLNWDNLKKAIEILNHPKMRGMGIRRMTISTAGVAPGILALAESGLDVGLSVSIHAPNDEIRSRLMPVNDRYPMGQVIDALKVYQKKTGSRITVEYVMLKKVNDETEHAYELAALLSDLDVYVNLIPYNPVIERYSRPSASRVAPFAAILRKLGLEVDVRKEKGADIDAACGQLRGRSE